MSRLVLWMNMSCGPTLAVHNGMRHERGNFMSILWHRLHPHALGRAWLLLAAVLLALALTACGTPPQTPPAASAPVAAAAPPDAKVATPWAYLGRRDYETQNPGLGYSERFQSGLGWIDVYVYDMRRSDWLTGTADTGFAAHFDTTVNEVRHFARQGVYAQLQVGETRDLKLAGQDFRMVSFQYQRDGKSMASVTYLTASRGRLVKYRMSLFAPLQVPIEVSAREFIETDFARRIGSRLA